VYKFGKNKNQKITQNFSCLEHNTPVAWALELFKPYDCNAPVKETRIRIPDIS